MLAFAGPVLLPRTSYNYHVRAAQTGQFLFPEFEVTVYGKKVTIPAARLLVQDTLPPSLPAAQRLLLDLEETNLFVGQSVHALVACPGSAALVLQASTPVQIVGQGVLVEQTAFRQRAAFRPRGPGLPGEVLYEMTLTPIASGKLPVFAQGYISAGSQAPLVLSGPGVFNSGLQQTLLDSDSVELHVRPLPREGELPGFTGAVGTFGLEPSELDTNVVTVGSPLKLSVKVRGDGNLARLVPPPCPQLRDWQVLPGPADNTPPQIALLQGFTRFSYILIPLALNLQATPAIPFSYFDPLHATYSDLTIPPLPVKILPGSIPADLRVVREANAATAAAEPEPTLSGLANSPGFVAYSLVPLQRQSWYPLVQLAPAIAFLLLALWERRRRYFEQHPDVLVRRRARRALRRARRVVRQAAQAGDAQAYASAAVSAMRVACAPHFPAEPRALVGQEVLAVLDEPERAGGAGQVVRRFFSVADAARFATAFTDGKELLGLKAGLEEVLQKLEEKL
jgi:hypothetical protein